NYLYTKTLILIGHERRFVVLNKTYRCMEKKLLIKNKIEVNKTIKIAAFRKDIRKTSPHIHNNYFEIIYLSAGSGYHFIDSRRYDVDPPVMYFIRKDQVHY